MKQQTYRETASTLQKKHRQYRREELMRMTTMQLADICEREVIPYEQHTERLDKDALIRIILQHRGGRTAQLIIKDIGGGQERLEHALQKTKKRELVHSISIPGKIVAYEGLDTNYFDGFTLPYQSDLDGINAVVLDNKDNICAILQVQAYHGQDCLYITRSGALPCRTADVKDHRLMLFPQKLSDLIFGVYAGKLKVLPPEISVYVVKLLDFPILKPIEATMPLAIDFGTSNTAAGYFVDHNSFEKIKDGIRKDQLTPGTVSFVKYMSPDGEIVPLLPTVIGVEKIENGKVIYNMGHEAEKMIADGYIEDGFCVFYDIKRWAGDYEQMEELSDPTGNRILVSRKEIIREFLKQIITDAEQRFKCVFKSVFLSYPVKQRLRFISLYREILPELEVVEDIIDEGVAVLYSVIDRIISTNQYNEGEWCKALIVDCGGGTTDLSACRFKINNERVSYNIQIETAYENGDTDFGGNNLTYRIMQLLKIALSHKFTGVGAKLQDIVRSMDADIYSSVESVGKKEVYKTLDEAYAAAEDIIPTKFKDYEYSHRDEYYMVRNNLYFLFMLAEKVKKEFFANPHILHVTIGSAPAHNSEEHSHVHAPRWKLAVRQRGKLSVQKEFPQISLNADLTKMVLHGDIYDIIHRFLDRIYETGKLSEYQIINLTGQSCKIDIFRDSLKEYLPGKLMRGGRGKNAEDFRLKLTCLDGAIRYVRDKRLGLAKVDIKSKSPSLPYELRAQAHSGENIVLIHPLKGEQNYGGVSRSLGSVELRLHLLNTLGEEKYIYHIFCEPDKFEAATYDKIEKKYGEHNISQAEVDAIENGEVRYFVWVESDMWAFNVVPVARKDEHLQIGERQVVPFEVESWLVNFFDGTH